MDRLSGRPPSSSAEPHGTPGGFRLEARREFWSSTDERQHITWKELKAAQLAVESFLPHLAGRNVLMHKDNHASSAAVSIVASRWEGKTWHEALTDMAAEELTVEPRAGLFRLGRQEGRGMIGMPHWTVTVFCVPVWHGCMKQYFRFSEEEQRPALAADPGTMARYVTSLGNLGTIKASSMQPYMSAVNNFFKDHGPEPMALGNMVGRVRKGFAASHVTLHLKLMRPPLPARMMLKALTLAKTLRLDLGLTWGTDSGTVVRVELLRASMAVWATTTGSVIGVMMQNIKYLGGWAMESNVVLDYIDPVTYSTLIYYLLLEPKKERRTGE
eukprot:jgi/Tetstr1/450211/TSEL_037250.t1